jgi:hypothetical protein
MEEDWILKDWIQEKKVVKSLSKMSKGWCAVLQLSLVHTKPARVICICMLGREKERRKSRQD